MKVRKLKDGDVIEIGDRIKVDTALGTQWQTVHRTTPKFAFVRYNEYSEGKYRREFNSFGFAPMPRPLWSNTQYSAWRPFDDISRMAE